LQVVEQQCARQAAIYAVACSDSTRRTLIHYETSHMLAERRVAAGGAAGINFDIRDVRQALLIGGYVSRPRPGDGPETVLARHRALTDAISLCRARQMRDGLLCEDRQAAMMADIFMRAYSPAPATPDEARARRAQAAGEATILRDRYGVSPSR
jgi:hypothetical protein